MNGSCEAADDGEIEHRAAALEWFIEHPEGLKSKVLVAYVERLKHLVELQDEAERAENQRVLNQ